MSLKKIYYNIENKYYEFVEKTGLYKITDKIDAFMPSMIFFILLIIAVIAGLLLLLPIAPSPQQNEIIFSVKSLDGQPVSGVPLLIITDFGKEYSVITNDYGITDSVFLPRNTYYEILVDYTSFGYDLFSESYVSDKRYEEKTIVLETMSDPTEYVNYQFQVVDSQSNLVSSGQVNFLCADGTGIAPSPTSVVNGTVNVSAEQGCNLVATVTSSGYHSSTNIPINTSTTQITLTHTGHFEASYDVDVYVKDSQNQGVSNIKVSAYREYSVLETSCITDVGGHCKLEGLSSGNYSIKTDDQRTPREYTEGMVTISGLTSNTTRTITVSRDITGYVLVKINNHNNQPIKDAVVYLKVADETISTGYTLEDGTHMFSVGNNHLNYRVVVDVEGFLIKSVPVIPVPEVPTNPTVINLEQVTAQTAQPLNLRVVSYDGRGYPNAQVVLYDAETGMLTDYNPRKTNYDGNVTFPFIRSGRYYARAFKGSSIGTSEEFEFDVRSSDIMDAIIIPMSVSKGMLNVTVVDREEQPVANFARVSVYDIYSGYTTPIARDLTDASGRFSVELDADQLVYVVVEDTVGNLGSTQSQHVYLQPEGTNLKVTLYPKRTPLSNPELRFKGIYRDDFLIRDSLKAGEEYQVKYTLFVPQNRSGNDRFEEVGAIISTGRNKFFEQESFYIKEINVAGPPLTTSTRKYTMYDGDMDYLATDDFAEYRTDDDAKWGLVRIKRPDYDYYSAYEIVVTMKVRNSAVFGEELITNYIGYGEKRTGEYEIFSRDNLQYVSQIRRTNLNEKIFSIGDETSCDDNFCFNMVIIDEDQNLRTDVTDNYSARPTINYTGIFTLINNSNRPLTNARIIIENQDAGLVFNNIKIIGQQTIDIPENKNKYDIPLNQTFDPDNTLRGEIEFSPLHKGEKKLTIEFVSDQQVVFTKTINIIVLSDKTFEVKVEPQILPAYKEKMNIKVEVNDASTKLPIIDQVFVSVKDRFKRDVISLREIGPTGEISLILPNPLQPNESIFVYVASAGYETAIKEIKATDKVFNITPDRLGVSLNVHSKRQETFNFKITNLISNELEIRSIELKGEYSDLELIEVQRVNNILESYAGTKISGVDSQVGGEIGTSKDIQANISINPRAEMLSEVRNARAYLFITLGDATVPSLGWTIEVPINITVGFDAIMDDPNCINLSENYWEAVVDHGAAETQFMLANACQINNRVVQLRDGIEAKVEFDSAPLGRFTVNTGNRLVELSSGYFKNIVDTVPAERSYPILIRYEPVGRYTGEISGRIVFRSVNKTTTGDQIITSEYEFKLHVISLAECYVLSKDVLEIRDRTNQDSFTIENKNCGMDVTYRLSCDDCPGIRINPKDNINVSATGSSNDIVVESVGAMPGMYVLNLFGRSTDVRGTEQAIGKIRVNVRPYDQCLDFDRYELDLYRSTVSETTGEVLPASSYDTISLINRCYKQQVRAEVSMKENSRLWGAILHGAKNGLMVGGARELLGMLGLLKSPDTEEEPKELNVDNIMLRCEPMKKPNFLQTRYSSECKLSLTGFTDKQLRAQLQNVGWFLNNSAYDCKNESCVFRFDKENIDKAYDVEVRFRLLKDQTQGTKTVTIKSFGAVDVVDEQETEVEETEAEEPEAEEPEAEETEVEETEVEETEVEEIEAEESEVEESEAEKTEVEETEAEETEAEETEVEETFNYVIGSTGSSCSIEDYPLSYTHSSNNNYTGKYRCVCSGPGNYYSVEICRNGLTDMISPWNTVWGDNQTPSKYGEILGDVCWKGTETGCNTNKTWSFTSN